VPSFGSLEGYVGASILVKALESIEGTPNRENIIDALEGLGGFNIGTGSDLHYSKEDHQASNKLWPTILRSGQFVSFEWKELKK